VQIESEAEQLVILRSEAGVVSEIYRVSLSGEAIHNPETRCLSVDQEYEASFPGRRSAEISVVEVPAPKLLAGCVLVRTAASLVSAGTERASSEFASKNLLQKARMRPDLVREVLSKISRDGLMATVSTVRNRLDQPSALGYSSAGTVVAVAKALPILIRLIAWRVPARVMPCMRSLPVFPACCWRAFPAQMWASMKLLSPPLARWPSRGTECRREAGRRCGVIGLGLLGQLTVQILKAAGCCVLGMDISAERLQLALRLGADAVSTSSSGFQDLCMHHSGGHGADAILIAAQTASNDPVNLAGAVARSRAVVVAVGTVAMDIPRRTFYEKELDFRVSRSYGPGRYDSAYEQKGIDYPIGYVRWTETRNMEAFLKLLADHKLDLQPLITHRFPIAQAHSAYDLITGKRLPEKRMRRSSAY